MSPLFGPILAQLVTLSVADRTEARYIIDADPYAEVATAPRIGLNFGWKHSTLTLGYTPSITVTPLEAKDPSVLVYHSGALVVSHRWARTTLTASQSGGYGKVNFRVQALADPRTAPMTGVTGMTPGTPTMTPPGGTPTTPANGAPAPGTTPAGAQTGAANQFQASNQSVLFATSVTSVGVSQAVSAVLVVNGELDYIVTGAVGSDESNIYPLVKGPRAVVSASYRLTRHDSVTTSVASQYATASTGNDAWLLFANEGWAHKFDARTSSTLGAGMSITRNSQADGLIYYSIYPNFVAGITHSTLLGRSTLSLGMSLVSAPFLDPVQGTVDPRISLGAFVGLNRDRFSTAFSVASAVSFATQGNTEALSSIGSSLSASYRVGSSLSVDGGVRAFWQTLGALTTIPFSAAVYVGVTFGAVAPLNGGH